MNWLNRLPVMGKLIWLSSGSLATAFVIIFFLVYWQQKQTLEGEWHRALKAQAEIIATNMKAAIIFRDKIEAHRLLNSLEANPSVAYATITIVDEEAVFASYIRPGSELMQFVETTPLNTTDNFRQQQHPIRQNDKVIANVRIISSLDELNLSLWKNIVIIAGTLLVLLTITLFFSISISRKITRPLTQLVTLSENFSHNPDVTQRVEISGRDELALLGNTFNHMLDAIQLRTHELQEYQKNLQVLVNERTSELAQAVKEADIANQAKSDFLARMSHEIRTPMNAVMGLSQLMQNTPLTEQQNDFIHKIRSSSTSLLNIINDILDFSKVEAGKLTIESIPFSINTLLDEIVDIISSKSRNPNVLFALKLDPQIPAILKGDSARIGQILINLLSNSLKFTHQGEVVLIVRLMKKMDQHAKLRFIVRDTGIGIHAKQQQQLFVPFQQADSSTSRKYGGTGLGLAISIQLANLMQGKLTLQSTPGVGSTFTLDLPIIIEDPTSWLPPNVSRGEKTILLIDNEPALLNLLEQQLSESGCRVVAQASGSDALLKLRTDAALRDQIDLIIINMEMPQLNGQETLQQLYQDYLHSEIPWIILTDKITPELNLAEAQRGITLSKPIRPIQLMNSIDKLLKTPAEVTEKQPTNDLIEEQPELKINGLQGCKILLAEDHPINQLVATEFIKPLQIGIDCVVNGLEAVQMVEKNHYDLVLMDIQMPEMDGLEATRIIRSNPKFKDLPIIALSAHALKQDIDKSLAVGMNDHMIKPLDQLTMQKVVLQWLNKSCGCKPESA